MNNGDGPGPLHVLTIKRVLEVPVAKVWPCWREPELLER